MMYNVIILAKAEKQLKKLGKLDRERIIKVLERIKIRPYSYVKKIIGSLYFRVRVGYYRIILDIREDKLLILVLELGHRKNIYKN